MILTTNQEFKKLAGEYELVPVARRIPADTETPVSTYLKCCNTPWSFLLESVEGGTQWGRYSIVGFDPFVTVEARDERALVRELSAATGQWEERTGDVLAEIRGVIDKYRIAHIEGLPRLAGGLVGYFGYGAARLFERMPPRLPDPVGLPDIRLFAPQKLLAFDNAAKTLDIIALVRPGGDAEEAYDKAMADIEGVYRSLRKSLTEESAFPGPSGTVDLKPLIPRGRFEEMVRTVKEAIFDGEAIQVVLSQPFEGQTDVDPFTAYRALRALNPSPYLFHLAMGEEVLVGGSPEVMVRVEEGRAMLRPIAGTRPRGTTPAEDLELEEELLADEKERAEHVMLVDLGRNDLGRIAPPSTVRLDESFVVERYSHVMHLVSTVSAELAEGVDGLDVLAATFPAGTLSGAPKVRAMELIGELEDRERSFYGGAVGYLGFDGNLDTCITIRTMGFYEGKVMVQAGAGIVADSVPEFEYEETIHKAAAVRRALEAAARGLAE